MTFSKKLAEESEGGITYTAYEVYEKFAKVPRYEIVTSHDGIAIFVDKCARTTWKRKFKELAGIYPSYRLYTKNNSSRRV